MAWIDLTGPITPNSVHDTSHSVFDFEVSVREAAEDLGGEVPSDLELLGANGEWADQCLGPVVESRDSSVGVIHGSADGLGVAGLSRATRAA